MTEFNLDDLPDEPFEFDCPGCGNHTVVDPALIRKMLSRSHFRCSRCGRRKRTSELTMFDATHGQEGVILPICSTCDIENDMEMMNRD